MKKLDTLVQDIYDLFNPDTKVEPTEEQLNVFADNVKKRIRKQLAGRTEPFRLRMSNIGKCPRELWYRRNKPDAEERLQPSTYIKFLFGDLIEELTLLLARLAGHSVRDEQRELEYNGIKGSCDATVDGVLVDVKSASTFSFNKFEKGLKKTEDSFGYLSQLGLYKTAIGDGASREEAGFIAVDKQHGHITVDIHRNLDTVDYDTLVKERIEAVSKPEPPPRPYKEEDFQLGGNKKLPTVCSYCPFKKTCWPGVRTFIYSYGPVYLTRVAKVPNVPEAT